MKLSAKAFRILVSAWVLMPLVSVDALSEDLPLSTSQPTSHGFTLLWVALSIALIFALLWGISRHRLKQAQDQVDNLSAILDTIDVYVYQKDTQGRYTYANQKEADLWQVDKQAVIGKEDSDFFDGTIAESIRNNDLEVINNRSIVTREERTLLPHSGKTEICLSTKQPIYDESGSVTGILGVSMDITAYKAIENREQATNHILRLLASETSMSVVTAELVECLQQHLKATEIALLESQEDGMGYLLRASTEINDNLKIALESDEKLFHADHFSLENMRVKVVDDYHLRGASQALQAALMDSGFSCLWSIEVTSRDHQHLGLLILLPRQFRRPTADEADFIERVAGFAGLAIERSKTNKMILAQKELLNTAIDEFPDAFMMKDYEGRYILANRAIADLYQTTPEDMIGKDDFDFTGNREQADLIRSSVREIMDRMETSVVYEESMDVSSGETRYFKSIKKPLLSETGERQILVIAQDITDIERAKAQLEDSNKQLNYVLNATADGVWDWSSEDNLVRHNERWNEISGFPLGARFHEISEFVDLVHEDDRERVATATMSSRQPGQRYDMEYRLRTRDGKVIWIEDYGEAVEWDEDGQPTRVVGSMSDITARKQSEQRIKYNEKLLRSSINSFDASFTIYDPENRLVLWNDHYLEHKTSQGIEIKAGMGMREILEKTCEKGFFQEAIGHEKEWVEKRMEIHGRPSSRTLLHSPDGDWFEVRTARTEDDYLIVGMIDISEFVRARQRADIANEAKSRFLATMSHELRTPMNGVLGMLELLSETTLSEEQRKYVETINQSGQSLLSIINDVLDHSKLESRMVKLESISFDLGELLQDCLFASSGLANQKNLSLTLDYPTGLPRCFLGDPGRLRQVIMNLLSNAIKFTLRGGVEISVNSQGRDANISDMAVVVKDSGIGIREEALDSLFDEFAQADQATTREFGGTGLGLAIARKLVELMGGEITVKSEFGNGSLFTVRLPLCHDEQVEAVPSIDETTSVDMAEQFEARVLLVEDVQINQIVAEKFLSALGCTVDIAENGEQALQSVKEHRYDLIFMDCRMPVMDGYEATKAIRLVNAKSDYIPIIALTANSSEEDWRACQASGMDAMITKPFRKRDLQQALNKWL